MSADVASIVLAGFAALVLVHVGARSFLLRATVGNDWTFGPRDHPVASGLLTGRASRALRNLLETAPAFLTLMLALHRSGRGGMLAPSGALVYLAGRAVYLPTYLSGLPWLRRLCWLGATLGLAFMLIGVLFA